MSLSLVTLLLLLLLLIYSTTPSQGQQWGQVFPGLESTVVKLDPMCAVNSHPMCCGLHDYRKPGQESTSTSTSTSGGSGGPQQQQRQYLSKAGHSHCKQHREYYPSAYETRHYNKAKELIEKYPTDYTTRRDELLKFITSAEEIEDAKIWLERVRVHMNDNGNSSPAISNDDDLKYLSRFRVTVSCTRNMTLGQWDEWIEPLSIHFRHPFAFEDLNNYNHMLKLPYDFKQVYGKLNITTRVNLMNNDYVLVHSGADSARHSVKSNSYMFDAGSSRWDSSTFWFACAYLQRTLKFDRFFRLGVHLTRAQGCVAQRAPGHQAPVDILQHTHHQRHLRHGLPAQIHQGNSERARLRLLQIRCG